MKPELAYLDSLQASGIRPGLGRMRALLAAAGRPHRRTPAVIVAGTNGKGSVSATLASILTASGVRTALYTSPHLVDLRERWQIDGSPVGEDELADAIKTLRAAARKSGIRPSYFEALTVVAFILFAAAECDLVVLEAGMGGRLDATNVVRPLAALITPVDFDHTEYLGRTLRRIAREKAGVIHRGATVLTSNQRPEVLDVLRRRCRQFAIPLHIVGGETTVSAVSFSPAATRVKLTTGRASYDLTSPLAGHHQVSNVALAVRAAEELGDRFPAIRKETIERGVAKTRWRGRFEHFEVSGREVWVDGAHNLHAIDAISALIEEFLPRPRGLVFGIMRDKDVAGVVARLFPLFDDIVVTEPYPPRSATVAELKALAGRAIAARVAPAGAIRLALRETRGPLLICGSLYLAGAAVEMLDKENAKCKMQNAK